MTGLAAKDTLGPVLVALARDAIREQLGLPPAAPDDAGPPDLEERRGTFVTLRLRVDGDLRGCVGMVEPRLALRDAVRRAAVGAAFRDHRFAPVVAGELAALIVQVSVLGPLEPGAPDAVILGRHGVMVRHRMRSGLLLPQVALEHGWDVETLLGQACMKAGLPAESWREPGCELLVFDTTSYSEPG